MSEKKILDYKDMDENDPIKVNIDAARMLDFKVAAFIEDLKALGQTEVCCCGPGYELSVKISYDKQ